MRQSNDYTALVRKVEDGGNVSYEAVLKEFGRSVAFEAATPERALVGAYEIGAIVIEDMLGDGEALPDVQAEKPWESYSGKMTLRMPRTLHYKLHVLAEDEGVSLNSLVMKILAEGAEHMHCQIRPVTPHSYVDRQLNVYQNIQQKGSVDPSELGTAYDGASFLKEAQPVLRPMRPIQRGLVG